MKASEIRLGNYYSDNGSVCRVTPNVIQEVYESKRAWCKPIPLTEEWLVKFGFELVGGYTDLWVSEGGMTVWWYGEIGRNDVMLHRCRPSKFKYQYVHQLQNLYFALTGEELILERKQLNSK